MSPFKNLIPSTDRQTNAKHSSAGCNFSTTLLTATVYVLQTAVALQLVKQGIQIFWIPSEKIVTQTCFRKQSFFRVFLLTSFILQLMLALQSVQREVAGREL
jgi:Na+-transporting NADH:ubiquinone oxidoreductase subunit NqrB